MNGADVNKIIRRRYDNKATAHSSIDVQHFVSSLDFVSNHDLPSAPEMPQALLIPVEFCSDPVLSQLCIVE